VPKGTPQEAIDKLNAAINKLQGERELKESLAGQGMLPRAGTPAAFDAIVRKDFARWTKVVADIGFKPD
jgi:tripartite-type tricarboxylate transporter receptor subunit TctC